MGVNLGVSGDGKGERQPRCTMKGEQVGHWHDARETLLRIVAGFLVGNGLGLVESRRLVDKHREGHRWLFRDHLSTPAEDWMVAGRLEIKGRFQIAWREKFEGD